MMTSRAFCRLACAAVACLLGSAAMAGPIGRVISLEGKATAVGADGATRSLSLKAEIFLGDRVRTSEGARLQVLFDDDTVISQGEKSEMTVDEYVYAPGNKKSNCALRFVQGVFRLITGQITKMNPDRFRVKTKMATIGIRGCDLAFEIAETAEKVYVLAFHAGESVFVYARPDVGEGEWKLLTEGRFNDPDLSRTHLRNVTQVNRVVTITSGGAHEASVVPQNLDSLINRLTTPVTTDRTGRATGTGGGTTGAGEGTGAAEGGASAGGTAPQEGWDAVTEGTDTAGAAGATSGTGDSGTTGTSEGEAGTSISQPSAPEPDPLTAPTPVVETGSSSVYTRKGGGTGWEWGIWTTDGSLDRVAFTASTVLSVSDYQTILHNSTLYRLTGTGASAAMISSGTTRSLVEGTCDLSVRIGQSTTPSWDGIFSMQNTSGDSLNFDASGTIQSDGALSGNQTSYKMSVNGQTYYRNSITAESISGNLLGPSGATKPTGAVGWFHFEHGSSATVNGGFGADLQ